jgi:hypothetical protein
MLKNKKILIVIFALAIVIPMLVFILSPVSFSDIQYFFIKPPIKANVSLKSPTIKAIGNLPLGKDLSNIENALIQVDYTNHTSNELTGVQIFVKVSPSDGYILGFYQPLKLSKSSNVSSQAFVYKAPNLKPGEKNTQRFFLIARKQNTYKLNFQVKSSEQLISNVSRATITAN